MSTSPRQGFWRERARGVGYVVLLGAALLVGATVIAALAVIVVP